MTALMIKDLAASSTLDGEARKAVVGGLGDTFVNVGIQQAVFTDISVLNNAKLGLGVDLGDGINIDVNPFLNVGVDVDLSSPFKPVA